MGRARHDRAHESEPVEEPPRTTERWIYGGLRVLNTGIVHAWLPEPVAGRPLPDELWYRVKTKGGWMVGGIYTATVTRTGQRVQLYDAPGPWLQPFEDREAVAGLEILDRSARDQIARTGTSGGQGPSPRHGDPPAARTRGGPAHRRTGTGAARVRHRADLRGPGTASMSPPICVRADTEPAAMAMTSP